MVLVAKNKVLIDALQTKLGLKRQSARAYASQIRKMSTMMNVPEPISFAFLDKDATVQRVADIVNVGQRKNMASALLAGTRAADMSEVRQNKYRKVMMSADADYRTWAASGTRSKGFVGDAAALYKKIKGLHKQVGRVITAKKLYKRTSLTFNELVVLQQMVYCKLLHFYEPRRLELASLRFITPEQLTVFTPAEQKQMNYILTPKRGRWTLVYSSYKTSKTYGQQRFDVTPGFKSTLLKIKRVFAERVPAGWIFFSHNGKPMGQSAFSKFVKDFFKTYMGKPWTSNTVRSIRVSALFKDAAPARELIAAQTGMASNLATLNLNYRQSAS